MKLFGMCIDKRAVVGVVVGAGLLWWLAPGVLAASWPLLIFAICPISMLLMMKAMNQMGGDKQAVATQPSPVSAATDDVAAAGAADVEARRN